MVSTNAVVGIIVFLLVNEKATAVPTDNRPLTRYELSQGTQLRPKSVPDNYQDGNNQNAGLFEGDIEMDNHPISYYQESFPVGDGCPMPPNPHILCNAVKDRSFIWPDGKVPYAISGAFNSEERTTIAHAISQYTQRTCIRFVPYSGESDYVYFVKEGGCWSYVGRRGGQQKVSLDDGCVYTGIAQHEMMHALGFFHEQSRADRDRYVTIKWDNIRENAKNNFQSYSLDRIDHLGTPYDYGSVMHYRKNAFSRNGYDTIAVRDGRSEIGQRERMSDNDVKKLRALYGCDSGGTVNPGTVQPQLKDRYPTICPRFKSWCWAIKEYCEYTCSSEGDSSQGGGGNSSPDLTSIFKKGIEQLTGGGEIPGLTGGGNGGFPQLPDLTSGSSGLTDLLQKGSSLFGGGSTGSNPFDLSSIFKNGKKRR